MTPAAAAGGRGGGGGAGGGLFGEEKADSAQAQLSWATEEEWLTAIEALVEKFPQPPATVPVIDAEQKSGMGMGMGHAGAAPVRQTPPGGGLIGLHLYRSSLGLQYPFDCTR